ncbi:MAG: hypothetical protein NTW87_10970 [Planctomycetota bacterium]|nr:hypothetical protein [Planctomycetota bacterium]
MLSARVKLKDNSAKVLKAVARETQKNLGKAGAYIRGIAMRSIKVSPEKAAPGKPPHTRKGRLKKAIVFAVNKAEESVVIGPTFSNVGKIGRTHEFGGEEPPKKTKVRKPNWKLDVGGHGPVRVEGFDSHYAKLRTTAQVQRAEQLAKDVTAIAEQRAQSASTKTRHYPPRPFMEPALSVAKERLPKLWANSVKGA